jgi:hypothetical protein
MYITQYVRLQAAWTKELTGLDIKNINYRLSFTPYYPTDGYLIEPATYYTFDGHVFVSFFKITFNNFYF